MLDGKKGVAQNILYDAFKKVEEKTGNPAMEVFDQAINNIMPVLELKVRRIGGANYQVPVEVSSERRMTLGLRWLCQKDSSLDRRVRMVFPWEGTSSKRKNYG